MLELSATSLQCGHHLGLTDSRIWRGAVAARPVLGLRLDQVDDHILFLLKEQVVRQQAEWFSPPANVSVTPNPTALQFLSKASYSKVKLEKN
jgi:hypothetical protein